MSRIYRVMDYIDQHLDDELSLETLAEVANFSRFHFHRIFAAMVGETLNAFIQRVRLEKAAARLQENHKESITDIALDLGFSGSAAFSRSFKEAFKMSPSQWRKQKNLPISSDSKICKEDSNFRHWPGKIGKDLYSTSWYIHRETKTMKWRITMNNEKKLQTEVTVKEMPDFHVAYVRHIGPYKGDSELFKGLFQKIMTWAGPRGLLTLPNVHCLSVYHDNPEITDESKLRTSICVTVPEDTVVDGEIGKMIVPGGKFAVGHFEIDVTQYQEAWDTICGVWLPQSGYQPDDRLCYELSLNNPEEHPEHKYIFDICVPVKPL